MGLSDISIKRPVFITVIITALIAVGILCYRNLTLNDMPEADIPFVTVTVIERGAMPEALETKVTKKVEDAVGQISGVKHISSTMTDNVSNTIIEFSLDKSPDVAAQEVRDKVNAIRGNLPSDIDEPVIAKYDITAQPVVSIAVTGSMENKQLSQVVDDVIKKSLATIKGVGVVNTYGNNEREIEIKLDKDKMAAYGLTTIEVVNSLGSDNVDIPGGSVNDGTREISLKTDSSITRVEDFNNILISKLNGTEIRIKDIAKVIDGSKDRDSLSLYQGKEAIGIDIVKQSGANTVEVADGVKKELESIKASLPQGVKIDIVRDNSVFIKDTVNDVLKTIIEGCILAVIIVFLFLNEWESTLISATSLPTSIITTFIALKLMKFTLNIMSLMALSLAVGLLIDDAIVVIENIVRHMHMGKSPIQAAKEGTSEIGFAVLATTLAVISVFLPIAMVNGIIGKYFVEFGLTIVFSMVVSLFVSFTLVPMMSSKLLKSKKKESKISLHKLWGWFNRGFDKLSKKYSEFLGVVLHHKMMALAITILMFVASLKIIPLLGFSFIPSSDQGEITINADLDSGLTLEAAEQKDKDIENVIGKYSEIKYIYSTVKKDNVSLFVKLCDKQERKSSINDIVERMRNDIRSISGLEFSVNGSSVGAGTAKDVSFDILGDNYDELQAFAIQAKNMMLMDPHVRDVSINYKSGKPEMKLNVDRNKAADLGVNSAMVASTINTLFNGTTVSKFDTGKDRYDVKVSLMDEQRKDLDSLNGIYVAGTGNQMIPLSQVTKKVLSTTSSSLHRYDRTGQVEISANVSGMATGDFLNLYSNKFKNEMQPPQGITVEVGGANGTMQEGFNSLITALIMGVFFLFMVMAAQFESYIDPIAIMFALPLALIGAILGLFIAGSELSIMSMIGIIMLMGLVAKNGILLIDFAKQRIGEGKEINEALKEAGLVRLRPILMTTLAMIFGMIPLTVATGPGTEMRAPMAHAVIGGLITSTILTLFIVPVMYTLLDDLKRLFKKKTSTAVSEEII